MLKLTKRQINRAANRQNIVPVLSKQYKNEK